MSLVGTQFTTVAMAWQIYELTNSPLQLGLLGLARGAPMLVLLLFGGLLADAVNRRHLMMATQIGQMCVSAGLAVMTLVGWVSPPILYTASLFLALFSSLEQPARTAIIPNLVPRGDLTSALALSGTQRHVATIIGPCLAGLPARSQRTHTLLRGRRRVMARNARRACHHAAPRPSRPRARRCLHAGSARGGGVRVDAPGYIVNDGAGFQPELLRKRSGSATDLCTRHSRRRTSGTWASLLSDLGRTSRYGNNDERPDTRYGEQERGFS